ncbi:serine/arginine repetitive matrix protein 2-like [Liolophura sinensis]|uniref:serine/arginine repetitive matrix protein 2-like n=1 Tax=Liolophura sinensis TaxID=3198878 RepID=UPI00315984B4
MFSQIMYVCVLSQTVMAFPVKLKYTYNISGRDDAKDSWNVQPSHKPKHLPMELSKSRILSVEHFLRRNISDILNSSEQNAFNPPEGTQHVSQSGYKGRLTVNSKVSSHRAQPLNLQISTFEQERHIVTGRGPTGTRADTRQKTPHPLPLHHTGTDFLKSLSDPAAVNQPSLSQNLPVQGALKIQPAKSDSGFTYEAKGAGQNSNGVAKALAQASNVQGTNPTRTTSTMILVISSTVVVLLVTCITVSIFQCCCRKKRNTEELQPSAGETKEEVDNHSLLRSRNSVHDTPTYRPLSINSTGDGLEEVAPQLSVRDKIKAFEGQSKPDQENKISTPEHGKPVRKRPKSKAFEEFENQGIIIGMGMVKSNRPKSTTEPDPDMSTEPGLLNEIMASMSSDYNNITMFSDTSDRVVQNSSTTSPDTEMSSSYLEDKELDEFSGVQRNTKILRSFKRAPPPKNRSRSKRSSRRRLPLKDATNLSSEDTTDGPMEIPDKCEVQVDHLKEQSPTDTSVYRVWKDFGSPSIHSAESRTDIDKIDQVDLSTNGNRSAINGHTPSTLNGYSQREEESRKRTDREATPPDKTSARSNHEISKPPPGVKMYENPCYESTDVIQASIHRASAAEKTFNGTSRSPERIEPSRLPRALDRHATRPSGEPHASPDRAEDRFPRKKSQSCDLPESQSRQFPDSRSRVSPESRRPVSPEIQSRVSTDSRSRVSPEIQSRVSPDFRSRVSPEFQSGVSSDSRSRVSPEFQSGVSSESHTSPDRGEKRASPPKTSSHVSTSRSEKRQSWKEPSPSNNEPMKPLKQTHL